jgi:hypothetical protein
MTVLMCGVPTKTTANYLMVDVMIMVIASAITALHLVGGYHWLRLFDKHGLLDVTGSVEAGGGRRWEMAGAIMTAGGVNGRFLVERYARLGLMAVVKIGEVRDLFMGCRAAEVSGGRHMLVILSAKHIYVFVEGIDIVLVAVVML